MFSCCVLRLWARTEFHKFAYTGYRHCVHISGIVHDCYLVLGGR